MKNIRIFNTDSKKKYKLKRVIAGLLAGTIISTGLTGCGFSIKKSSTTKNTSSNDYSTSSIYEDDYTLESSMETSSESEYEEESLDLDSLSNQIINSKITLDSNIVNNFINKVSSIKVNYPYSDLFGTKEILSKYESINEYKSLSGNLFVNNQLDSNYLYSIVLSNNEKEAFKSNAVISNTDLKRVCDVIVETLNYEIKNNSNIDLNLLSEKIFQLKIKKFEGFSNGSYDSTTGIMGFDIKKLNSNNNLFKTVIEHETNHLIQSNSLNEVNNSNYEIRLGISYKFKDTKVNSLYLKWLSEGTAESLMMRQSNLDKALTYDLLIRNLNIIKVATLLDDKNNIYNLEELSLNSNLDELFSYFNCKSESDKIEVLNLMYSYEIISKLTGDSSSEDFFKAYKSLYGDMSFKEKSLFEKQIKGSIGQTLSKNFYKNLASKISDKNICLNEIFELVSMYESVTNAQTWYSATGYAKDIKEFMTKYIDIQTLFFEMIANKLNISVTDVSHAYNVYNANIDLSISNISILSEDKIEFYEKMKQNFKKDKVKSIKYYYDKNISNNKFK